MGSPLTVIMNLDALEKASRQNVAMIQRRKKTLLSLLEYAKEKEQRWHLAQMVTRLKLTRNERVKAVRILYQYLRDRSSIVRTEAIQALAEFALRNRSCRAEAYDRIQEALLTGTPAMHARVRKLLREGLLS